MSDENNPIFFVQVRKSHNIQALVLHAQKELIEGMQRYEKIKFLRDKKVENINELRKIVKELVKLLAKLKLGFPDKKVRQNITRAKKKAQTAKQKKTGKKQPAQVQVIKPKPQNEVDWLEAELNAIEQRLNALQ